MRLMNIKGQGKISKAPDTIEIILDIITVNKDYEEMMKEAGQKISILTQQLVELGFDEKNLKTTNFMINAKYDNEYDQNGKHTQNFIGYETRHTVKLEFPINLDLLSDVLSVISRNIVKPELRILFTIKDKALITKELLESAVKDAKNKANILANASGVRVGEIQEINYNWAEIRPYSDTMIAPQALYSIEKINIVPENIELNEFVNISFEIV